MPRKVNHEAKLLADLERISARRAALYAEDLAAKKALAQERYRQQRQWEAKVGRFAWEAGLSVLELGEVQQLLNKLTPHDLDGNATAAPDEDYAAVISGNS